MTYTLYLDDERPVPINKRTHKPEYDVLVKTPKEFKDVIKARGMPSFISFDWYLGVGWQDNGQTLIEWLIDQDQHGVITFPKDFFFGVHSSDHDKNRIMHRTLAMYLESKGIL